MAEACSRDIKKEVVTYINTKEYHLILNQDEADVLYTILRRIGGSDDTPRAFAKDILKALVTALDESVDKYADQIDSIKNSIYFK